FSSPTTRKTTPTWSPSLPYTAQPCWIIFQETAVTSRILLQVAPLDDVVVAAGVPEPPRRGRLDVHRAARPELERLALHLEPGPAGVDEVELVLAVMEVVEPLRPGREDDRVHAERRHAQLLAQLAEDAGPERVDRRQPVCHSGTLERA